jgi:twitching motility protein PilT
MDDSKAFSLETILKEAVSRNASDVHLTVALPPMFRVRGELVPYGEQTLNPAATQRLCLEMLTDKHREVLEEKGEVDFSYVLPSISRFRVNVYKQRKSYGAALRIIFSRIPTLDELNFPSVLKDLAMKPRGLVLVTGPTGSGKSTTLAAMVNHVNQTRNSHVLTLEEPIEYLHRHGKSMINQREIGDDSLSFAAALRAALREDPDVILVGEMRDLETIATAVSAAETGHLVMSTLHTTSAPQTIDRVIDVFPPFQQQQIRVQLAGVLQGIISQQLMPTLDGKGRVAALEILLATDGVRNIIREGKTHQLMTVIQTSHKLGMVSMDYSLAQLARAGKISAEEAYTRCQDQEMLKRYMALGNSPF